MGRGFMGTNCAEGVSLLEILVVGVWREGGRTLMVMEFLVG